MFNIGTSGRIVPVSSRRVSSCEHVCTRVFISCILRARTIASVYKLPFRYCSTVHTCMFPDAKSTLRCCLYNVSENISNSRGFPAMKLKFKLEYELPFEFRSQLEFKLGINFRSNFSSNLGLNCGSNLSTNFCLNFGSNLSLGFGLNFGSNLSSTWV